MNFDYRFDYATDCLNSQALFLKKRIRFIPTSCPIACKKLSIGKDFPQFGRRRKFFFATKIKCNRLLKVLATDWALCHNVGKQRIKGADFI